MGKKYEFTGQLINFNGHILQRIRRIKDGKMGGWIDSEDNLSHFGSCWIADNAKVYGNAKVTENAQISGEAQIFMRVTISGYAEVTGHAHIDGNVTISDKARISGNAHIGGMCTICDQAIIGGNAQIIGSNVKIQNHAKIYDNATISGYAIIKDFAKIYGNAEVSMYAKVGKNAQVYDNAIIRENAKITDYARIYGFAKILGHAVVKDTAKVFGSSRIVNNAIISGKSNINCPMDIGFNVESQDINNILDSSAKINNTIQWYIDALEKSKGIKIECFDFDNSNYIANKIVVKTLEDSNYELFQILPSIKKDQITYSIKSDIHTDSGYDIDVLLPIKSDESFIKAIEYLIAEFYNFDELIPFAMQLENALE